MLSAALPFAASAAIAAALGFTVALRLGADAAALFDRAFREALQVSETDLVHELAASFETREG